MKHVEVRSSHPGARIHEFGGVITPKSRSKLRFEIGGKVVFTTRAHIPARPYMRPAYDQSLPRVKSTIMRVATQFIERLVK